MIADLTKIDMVHVPYRVTSAELTDRDPNDPGKYLQVHFTIENEGTFTTPWTATMIYLRDRLEWPEVACAENTFGFHSDKELGIPTANKPDF